MIETIFQAIFTAACWFGVLVAAFQSNYQRAMFFLVLLILDTLNDIRRKR